MELAGLPDLPESNKNFRLHLRIDYVSMSPVVAEWSSLVARRAHNPKVVGSNPASASPKNPVKSTLTGFFHFYCKGI